MVSAQSLSAAPNSGTNWQPQAMSIPHGGEETGVALWDLRSGQEKQEL